MTNCGKTYLTYIDLQRTYWKPTNSISGDSYHHIQERIRSAMNNSFTNTTNATQVPPGQFDYLSLAATVLFLTPLLLFNILLIVAIAKEKSIVGTLRLVLVNIITAGQVVTVGLIMIGIANVIISGYWCPELRPSDFACRLMLWVTLSGGAARLMYLTTFAISVCLGSVWCKENEDMGCCCGCSRCVGCQPPLQYNHLFARYCAN